MQRLRVLPVYVLPRRRALALLCWTLAGGGLAESSRTHAAEPPHFRVIVHPNNPLRAAERAFIADIFLKKVTRWSEGEVIRVVDLRFDNPSRRRFSEEVIKRSVGAVRSYWQQRIFSGRDVPPPELESDEEVVAFVARSPAAIGYVSGTAKLAGVRELGVH